MDDIKYQTIWNPQEDITVYELAQCIPYTFSLLHDIRTWDDIDESITRHFTVTKFAYKDMIMEQAKKVKKLLKETDHIGHM